MNKLLIIIAAAGLTLSTGAFAQDNSTTANPTTFAAADADSSGGVSFEEAQAVWPDVTQDQFNTADANTDGSLDEAEFGALSSTLQTSAGMSTTTNDTTSTDKSASPSQ
jgi:hypothetical protein